MAPAGRTRSTAPAGTTGTELGYLWEIVEDWTRFDWATRQKQLNELNHLRVEVDGLGVHAIRQRAAAEDALPLVLLHGWPSSFVQMLPILPLLDTFHVVVLSLPGYGFSDRPATRGMDVARVAGTVVAVMEELGYPRFATRGSDLGAGVLQQLALAHPERLVALHLPGTNPYLGHVPEAVRGRAAVRRGGPAVGCHRRADLPPRLPLNAVPARSCRPTRPAHGHRLRLKGFHGAHPRPDPARQPPPHRIRDRHRL